MFLFKRFQVLVNKGKGRLFRRKDGKYIIYVPKDLAEDTGFPIEMGVERSIPIEISFEVGDKRLVVEKWKEKKEGED